MRLARLPRQRGKAILILSLNNHRLTVSSHCYLGMETLMLVLKELRSTNILDSQQQYVQPFQVYPSTQIHEINLLRLDFFPHKSALTCTKCFLGNVDFDLSEKCS